MISRLNQVSGPHRGQPVLTAGAPLEQAEAAMILVHGRGATAESILTLVDELSGEPGNQERFAFLAPQAAGDTWYPQRFLVPAAQNEPWLSSALSVLETLLTHLEEQGLPPEKTILLGFSQGACLALEFAARNPRRYGGLVGLSGGLIGTDQEIQAHSGSLEGTPVLLGCSQNDFHIPEARVWATARILEELEAQVTTRLYPGLGHTVNQDEIQAVRVLMDTVLHPAA